MSNLKGFQQTEPLPHLLRPLGSVGIQARKKEMLNQAQHDNNEF